MKYLRQLRKLDASIKQKSKEATDLRNLMTRINGVDYTVDIVQTSQHDEANFIKKIERLIELEREINNEIDIFVDTKHKIIKQIQKLDDVNHVNILYKRYVELKNFDIIGKEMGYSRMHVHRIHKEAVKEFERCYTMLHLDVI